MAGRNFESMTNVALTVACIALTVLVVERLWSERGPTASASAVQPIDGDNLLVQVQSAAAEGRADAKVLLLEFSDYECPFCGRFARDTYGQVKRDYIDSGKVRHAFRHYPLPIHAFALDAARAAECALRTGRYWEMHERLFANQKMLAPEQLAGYAAELGIEPAAFSRCLKEPATDARIAADREEAGRLRVASTPTFFVGVRQPDGRYRLMRKVNGAHPYSVFASVLDEVGSAATATARGPEGIVSWLRQLGSGGRKCDSLVCVL